MVEDLEESDIKTIGTAESTLVMRDEINENHLLHLQLIWRQQKELIAPTQVHI